MSRPMTKTASIAYKAFLAVEIDTPGNIVEPGDASELLLTDTGHTPIAEDRRLAPSRAPPAA